MPLASWPASANREVQTIPIRPGLRRVPAAELPVPRLGAWLAEDTAVVVTLGYGDQLVEVEAMAAVTGGPTAARWPLPRPPRRGNHDDLPATHDHGSNDIGIASQNW